MNQILEFQNMTIIILRNNVEFTIKFKGYLNL